MNKQPFFSIIIPVFNAAESIPALFKSLDDQTCDDFEVIFVDDYSSDKSVSILKKYVRRTARVTLIELSKSNGAGAAFNIGIKESTGIYLHFHNAQDHLDQGALGTLKDHLTKQNLPDMTIFQYSIYDVAGDQISGTDSGLEGNLDKLDGLTSYKLICHGKLNPSTWNKVFQRENWLRQELKFQCGYTNEDVAFIPYACLRMRTVTVCQEAKYHYCYNPKGMTFEINQNQVVAAFESLNGLRNLLETENNYPQLRNDFIRFGFHSIDHNFFHARRNELFSDDNVNLYASQFLGFYKENGISPVHIFNCDQAMHLVMGLLISNRSRSLNWDFKTSLSLEDIEGIIDYNYTINDQVERMLPHLKEIGVLQAEWFKKESEYIRKVEKLKRQNNRLKRTLLNRLARLFG